MAALTLSLALLCMLVVIDSGRLYLEKRSLQRVADVAALEAASRKGNCLAGTSAVTYANQSLARNGFTPGDDGRTVVTRCGLLTLDANSRRIFTVDSSKTGAIQVVVTHGVPRSIAAGIGALFDSTPAPLNIALSATAVAAQAPPLASLTIRSAAATIDTSTAALLNALVGRMLGSTLNLSVASWQALADAKIDLLTFLDQLKTNVRLSALNYTQVLASEITAGELLDATVHALDPSGTLNVAATISSLTTLKGSAGPTKIVVGNLLSVQGSTDMAGLKVKVGLLDLIQGSAELANNKNGAVVDLGTVQVPGVVKASTRISVIEPPQISAIGDPSKIDPLNPMGPDRIYVRTAQIRALVSINLPVLTSLAPVVTATSDLLGPVTGTLNSLLSLNLTDTLSSLACLLGAGCKVTDLKLLPSSTDASQAPTINLSLSLASAQTYVSGYSCASNADKSLAAQTTTTLVDIKLGGPVDPAAFFSSAAPPPSMAPVTVLDIGTKVCHRILGIGGSDSCQPRVAFAGGGIGLSINSANPVIPSSPVVPSSQATLAFRAPNLPEIGSEPAYAPAVAQLPSSLVPSLLQGINVQVFKPSFGNILGDALFNVGNLLNGLTTALSKALSDALVVVLDPLLKALGVTVAPAQVGANLSCNFGQAFLVI
jgi:uncharacterized membrane protein